MFFRLPGRIWMLSLAMLVAPTVVAWVDAQQPLPLPVDNLTPVHVIHTRSFELPVAVPEGFRATLRACDSFSAP